MTESLQILRPRNILIFLTTFCLLVGHRTNNPGLWMLGWGAAALCLTGAVSTPGLFRRLQARRIHTERSFQGQEVQVELQIESLSSRRLFLTEVSDAFPPGAAFLVRSLVTEPWGGPRAARIVYRGECIHHRGLYLLGPLRLKGCDPLGLFDREQMIPLFTQLLVYPQAPELMQFNLLGEGTCSHVGIETVRRRGRSEEFIGLREYRRGDPPRLIHWPTSAHHGRLLVKEFQDERTTEVTLMVDLSRLGLTGLGDQTTAEYAVQAAATLARQAFDKSHAFQLFVINESIEHVPLGGGLQHLLTVLDRLTFVRPGGERRFIEEASRLRSFLHPGSTLVLIFSSTLFNPDLFAPFLEDLVSHQIKVISVLIDDRSFPKLFKDQEFRQSESLDLSKIIEQLHQLGAVVHVLSRHSQPSEAIRRGLS